MGISLFKRLSDAHPGALTKLTHQYRMNASVMQLANKLFYRNQLTCGSEEVASASLDLPLLTALLDPSSCPDFVQRCLDSKDALLYLDTSAIAAPETKDGKRIRNMLEADLVVQLTR
jgi:DNA replication ATP-dependent helicase Dna2